MFQQMYEDSKHWCSSKPRFTKLFVKIILFQQFLKTDILTVVPEIFTNISFV